MEYRSNYTLNLYYHYSKAALNISGISYPTPPPYHTHTHIRTKKVSTECYVMCLKSVKSFIDIITFPIYRTVSNKRHQGSRQRSSEWVAAGPKSGWKPMNYRCYSYWDSQSLVQLKMLVTYPQAQTDSHMVRHVICLSRIYRTVVKKRHQGSRQRSSEWVAAGPKSGWRPMNYRCYSYWDSQSLVQLKMLVTYPQAQTDSHMVRHVICLSRRWKSTILFYLIRPVGRAI